MLPVPAHFESLPTRLPEIEGALHRFASVPKKQWIRELAVCLLTPQSSPYRAESAISKLEALGFFEGANISQEKISEILRTPSEYVRFHNVKAKRLLHFREHAEKVLTILHSGASAVEEREALVQLVDGFSLKEASHALRNVGRRGLAILDRHILRNLASLGVIEAIPTTMTKLRYLEIEERFRSFSTSIQIDMDVLDLFFWSKETGSIFK